MKIRNFVYLDVEKMYSLSSQIFEGVTEYVLNESQTESSNSESQKGPVGSGKILGDILKQQDKRSERKFLNDYSYTLFEDKLIENDRVIEISEKNSYEKINTLVSNKSFIKVKGKAIFNDIQSIQHTLTNLNKIGESLTCIGTHQEAVKFKKQIEQVKDQIKDRNKRSQLAQQVNAKTNVKKLAKESGLQHDPAFLESLSFLFNYGFQDQLEVQVKLNNSIVSANLKRSELREDENLIIRKYSRQTEVEFVLFGFITQYQNTGVEDVQNQNEAPNVKEAIRNLVAHLTNIESNFSGRLSNEIIVDPIALYTEL